MTPDLPRDAFLAAPAFAGASDASAGAPLWRTYRFAHDWKGGGTYLVVGYGARHRDADDALRAWQARHGSRP